MSFVLPEGVGAGGGGGSGSVTFVVSDPMTEEGLQDLTGMIWGTYTPMYSTDPMPDPDYVAALRELDEEFPGLRH